MPSLFGEGSPLIILPGETITLPVPKKGSKIQSFIAEVDFRTDFAGTLHEELDGYRLYVNYKWDNISATDREAIIRIVNTRVEKYIKFPGFLRRYPIIVDKFEPGHRDGYDDADEVQLILRGKHLLESQPSVDAENSAVIYYTTQRDT